MDTNDKAKKSVGANKLKGHCAKEIETRPGAHKVAFVSSDGEYHIFHDLGLYHVRFYRTEEHGEILEFEASRHLAVLRGHNLEVIANLFLDSELVRVRASPPDTWKKNEAEDLAFVTKIEVGLASIDEDDDFPDQ